MDWFLYDNDLRLERVKVHKKQYKNVPLANLVSQLLTLKKVENFVLVTS